jgi:hypothetical protein
MSRTDPVESRRFQNAAVFASVLISVLIIGLMWRFPALLVPKWYDAAQLHPAPDRILLVALVLLTYCVGWWLLGRARSHFSMLWSLLGGSIIPLALLSLWDHPLHLLFACVESGDCTGGFSLSLKLSRDLLRDWPTMMASWRNQYPHLSISAPGWPLLYVGLARLIAGAPDWLGNSLAAPLWPLQCAVWGIQGIRDSQIASMWLGLLAPFWTSLTIVPLSRLARLVGNRRLARSVQLWWPLVPAVSLFTTTSTPVYALPTVCTVLLIWFAMRQRAPGGWILGVIAGMLFGLMLWISFSVIPLLLFLAWIGLAFVFLNRNGVHTISHPILVGMSFALGAAISVVFGNWLTGDSLIEIMQNALRVHWQLPATYLDALWLHAWDFGLFAGVPLMCLMLGGMFGAWQTWRQFTITAVDLAPDGSNSGETRFDRIQVSILTISLALTLSALVISGTARGEVGRVWIFLMPFAALAGAQFWQDLPQRAQVSLVILQGVLCVTMASSFTPVNTALRTPPSYAQVAVSPWPEDVIQVGAKVGDGLTLVSYQARPEIVGQPLRLQLHWLLSTHQRQAVSFALTSLDTTGREGPPFEWQPFGTRYPATCWRPGVELIDEVVVPAQFLSGQSEYRLRIRVSEPQVKSPRDNDMFADLGEISQR